MSDDYEFDPPMDFLFVGEVPLERPPNPFPTDPAAGTPAEVPAAETPPDEEA